jgi:hypothetical protein
MPGAWTGRAADTYPHGLAIVRELAASVRILGDEHGPHHLGAVPLGGQGMTGFLPNGTGILPRSPAPAASSGAATGASPPIPSFPPGADPAGRIPMREVWPLSTTPLALAALPQAPSCAGLRTRVVAAEWGLGAPAVPAGQVARDLAAAAVAACAGLPGQAVVRRWLRGDGS